MKKRIFCQPLEVTMFYLLVSTAGVVSRASFGNECNQNIRCDSQKFLSCSTSRQCDCLMPNSMVFDETTEKCVTLAGERCEYSTVGGDQKWANVVPCIAHSACKNGICECVADHYEVSNGTCSPKRTHGEKCESNDMCQEKQHLFCENNRKCSCQPNRAFSEMHNLCALLEGESCSYHSEDKCTENSECNGNTCSCVRGYFSSDERTCVPKRGLGEPCKRPEHCKTEVIFSTNTIPSLLTCHNGTCSCDSVKGQSTLSSNGIKFCGKAVGARCNYHETNTCIPGAYCDPSSQTCQCNHNSYFETSDWTCQPRKKFNDTCNKSSQCDYLQDNLICSKTDGTCQCDTSRIIDPETKSCKLRPNSKCRDSNDNNCVPYAYCSGHSNQYRCYCTGNATKAKNLNDYCYIKEGKTCYADLSSPITSKTCLPGLLCRNKTCTCPYKGHQVYNESMEKCVSFLAGPCNQTSDCHDLHAECTQDGSYDGLQCRCKTAFVGVGNECQLAFGQKCSQREGNLACDSIAPLECGSSGVCECADLQVYDKEKLECTRLVGSRCSIESGDDHGVCVAGAVCKRIRGFDKTVGVCSCQVGWKMKEDRTCVVQED